jgi:hypothetical protein
VIEGVATGPQKDHLDGNAGTAIAPKSLGDCGDVASVNAK